LPKWFRNVWLFLAPLGFLFSVRIIWEKTFLTWREGPQMIGFSLMHIHPTFFVLGMLCCYGLAFWLFPATFFLIKRRKQISKADAAMGILCLFVIVVMVIPDNFFA
jgi:hypothetical protein